ncbi:acyl-CoA thioesterase [Falsibacillus albus]|uniref:acyl-CoA thioesterase n=1 Tax=Falsibacillus albus TaxID=2478915 RepID=UPI001F403705|nr:thioesterase family protein [Falsibacillus albus]
MLNRVNYIDEPESWKEAFSFSHSIKVRFSETDMFGHLNNTVPFTYFEEARIEFFKFLGFMQDWVHPDSGEIPVVADLQCDFIQQVFFGQTIQVHVKPESIGNSSMDLHYMGTNEDGCICFVGRGTIVQMSKKTGKGAPWTEDMKERMANAGKRSNCYSF